MKKRKLCFYPIWNYEKLESFLCEMESNGYRVEKRKLLYFFDFKKVVPKKTDYFLTFTHLGDSITMYPLEMELKRRYNASLSIDSSFEAPAIYRVCNSNAPTSHGLLNLRKERNKILERICIKDAALSFSIFVIFMLVCAIFGNLREFLISLFFTVPFFLTFLYKFTGAMLLRKKH